MMLAMVVGCSTTNKKKGGEETVATAATEAPAAEGTTTTGGSDLLSQTTVYFDFDSSDVRAEFNEVLMAHAKHAAESGAKLVIEGHADERGSREYNIGLGERRAQAVKQFLVLNGVSADSVTTNSYGEERPADAGHDEAAWAKNRRGEVVYESK
jgi:peptidoglycan-associated lipoprotein